MDATRANLFEPYRIGAVALANRVVMLPMGTRFTGRGRPEDRDVAFYRARAAGGVGLIVTGGTIVSPTSTGVRRELFEAFDEAAIPDFRRLVDAVHEHGTPIFGQLLHRGWEMSNREAVTPVVGPSARIGSATGDANRVLDEHEVEAMVERFARGAEHLLRAGYDGIEVHGSHGYLVDQFLREDANGRDDRYGGSRAGRARFLLEIAGRIRERCGSGFPLGVRLGVAASDEQETAELVALLRHLQAQRAFDYVSLSIGRYGRYIRDMATPEGALADVGAAVRRSVRLPVLLSQRIASAKAASEILESGAADLVGLARGLIADPEWPRKVRAGRERVVLPCVACMQDCRSRPHGIACTTNPAAGREQRGPVPRARTRKRVTVIGGGPAGLEAALASAEAGHAVSLFEREPELGGQIRLAARGPHRAAIAGLVAPRVAALAEAGVAVTLGQAIDADAVRAAAPDVVLVASGAREADPPEVLRGGPPLRTARQVLGGEHDELLAGARTALAVDRGWGGWPLYSAIEYVAARGVSVALVTAGAAVGANIPAESLRPLRERLDRAGLDYRAFAEVLRVTDGVVVVGSPITGRVAAELSPDLVLTDPGMVADRTLEDALAGSADVVLALGDASSPRTAAQAIYDGRRAGRSLVGS